MYKENEVRVRLEKKIEPYILHTLINKEDPLS